MAGSGSADRRVPGRARCRRSPARAGGDERGDHAGRRHRDERGQPGLRVRARAVHHGAAGFPRAGRGGRGYLRGERAFGHGLPDADGGGPDRAADRRVPARPQRDRKSTRLNSSHSSISYAVFCLKKKKKKNNKLSYIKRKTYIKKTKKTIHNT